MAKSTFPVKDTQSGLNVSETGIYERIKKHLALHSDIERTDFSIEGNGVREARIKKDIVTVRIEDDSVIDFYDWTSDSAHDLFLLLNGNLIDHVKWLFADVTFLIEASFHLFLLF